MESMHIKFEELQNQRKNEDEELLGTQVILQENDDENHKSTSQNTPKSWIWVDYHPTKRSFRNEQTMASDE